MSTPQTIVQVEALYLKLRRDGFIRDGSAIRVGACVQARVRGVVLCGLNQGVLPPIEDRPDRHVVVTAIGDFFVTAANLRPCGDRADGLCTCSKGGAGAPAWDRRSRARAAVTATPLGNTGVNRAVAV